MRARAFFFCAVATIALSVSCPLSGQETAVYETQTTIGVYSNKMELGEIVGVQYTDDGRYVIFATPKGKNYANLWRDEVIQVARLALEVTDATHSAVSFDFARKASGPFRMEDILDPAGLGRALRSDHPFAAALRRLPDAGPLAEALAPGTTPKTDKRILKRAVVLLNLARDSNLAVGGDGDFLSPTTRRLVEMGTAERHRLNRLVLEDFFSPSVDRDVESRYVMEYTSKKAETLLRGRRTEAIVMDADTDLKHISAGRAGGVYAIGPPEIVLCAEQARSDLQQGKEPHRGEYFTYLDLSGPEYLPLKEGGVGAWMQNATLTAHADHITGETPECGTRYASNLSRKLPFILEQEGDIPQHLRDLKTMLVLRRIIEFLNQNAVPLSPDRLRELALDTERLPNRPPNVVQVPMAIAGGGRAMLFSISGGIELEGDQSGMVPQSQVASAPRIPPRDTPGFVVTTLEIGGRSLWAIDVSSILAP